MSEFILFIVLSIGNQTALLEVGTRYATEAECQYTDGFASVKVSPSPGLLLAHHRLRKM